MYGAHGSSNIKFKDPESDVPIIKDIHVVAYKEALEVFGEIGHEVLNAPGPAASIINELPD